MEEQIKLLKDLLNIALEHYKFIYWAECPPFNYDIKEENVITEEDYTCTIRITAGVNQVIIFEQKCYFNKFCQILNNDTILEAKLNCWKAIYLKILTAGIVQNYIYTINKHRRCNNKPGQSSFYPLNPLIPEEVKSSQQPNNFYEWYEWYKNFSELKCKFNKNKRLKVFKNK